MADADPADAMLAQARGLLRRLEIRLREANRQDLLDELARGADRPDDRFTIVVAGEANRGKTSILNALVDRPRLLPVAADTPTAAPVVVRRVVSGEQEGSRVVLSSGDHVDVGLGDLGPWVADVEAQTGAHARSVSRVEIALDHPLLADGLTLVDTPGVGGLRRAHGAAARAALEIADAVVFVLDAGAPINAIERGFLREAIARVGAVVIALNKIDVHPGFDQVQREDEQLLARDVPDAAAPILPVSARAKIRADRLAVEAGDDDALVRDLRVDSGFLELSTELHHWATARASAARAASLTRLGLSLAERLLEPERALVENAEAGSDERKARIGETEQELEDLKRRASDARHDVSDRVRLLQREIDVKMRRALADARRTFIHRVSDGDTDGLEDDFAARLYEILTEVRSALEEQLGVAVDSLLASMEPHRLDVAVGDIDAGQVGDVLDPDLLPEHKVDMSQLLQRAPYAVIPLALGSIPAGAAGVVALLVGRRFVARKGRHQQLQTYIIEACKDWEHELGLMINTTCVLGGSAIIKAFDASVRANQRDLSETVRALTAQVNQSVAQRQREREAAEQRITQVEDVRKRLRVLYGAVSGVRRGVGVW